jgi:LysR family transcriptional activator of dmlA
MKNRQKIEGLVLFSHINQLGSLTAAAQLLGINRSTVSKKLAVLEKSIGVRLLKRTTRKIALTEVGRKVLQEARKVEAALQSIEYISDDFQSVIAGDLNVTCAAAQGRAHLVPLLTRFLQQYPMVNVNLLLEDRFVDMIAENVDVSIRIGYLPDSTLIARKVGDLSGVLCASPEYLRIAPPLRSPSDLLNHPCLFYRSLQAAMNTWSFAGAQGEEQVTVAGHLSINDPEALIKAACDHAGVLLVDRGLVGDAIENGSLVTVLPDYECIERLPMYVVYPYKKFMPTKTRVLIDFLLKELPVTVQAE